jgi:hypothetical protein
MDAKLVKIEIKNVSVVMPLMIQLCKLSVTNATMGIFRMIQIQMFFAIFAIAPLIHAPLAKEAILTLIVLPAMASW